LGGVWAGALYPVDLPSMPLGPVAITVRKFSKI